MDRMECALKPIVICQYGKECIKTDADHFREYNHEHLNEIIGRNTAVSNVEQYQIPEDISIPTNLILQQIKIVCELFPNQQVDENVDINPEDTQIIQPLTSDSTNVALIEDSFDVHDYVKVMNPKGKMLDKLTAARPYNYFLTCVTSSPQTHGEPMSVTFQEILDPSLGELECSVQINCLVHAEWLFVQYHCAGHLDKPMIILYGRGCTELDRIATLRTQITAHKVEMAHRFGSHHSKIMLLGYKDGSMRVVISTANLYDDDWHNRTQGLWMSEKLQAMPSDSDTTAGESETEFRSELLEYLASYNLPNLLGTWIQRIQKTDFTSVN